LENGVRYADFGAQIKLMYSIKLSNHRLLMGIIILAVTLRLGYVLFFSHTLSLQTSGYDAYATNLVAGNGYTRFADLHPDSDLPPLYSFFLAAIYVTLGRDAIVVAVVQILFDVITLLAIYAIGYRIGGRPVGILATAFTGFYPYLVFQNLTVNDTGLFIMLLSVSIWALYEAMARCSWRLAAVSGTLLGAAALTKSLVVLLLPFSVLLLWRTLDRKKAWHLGFALLLAFAFLPGLWMIRNARLHNALVFISTNDGSNLFQGNNPLAADLLLQGYDVQWTPFQLPRVPTGLTEIQEAAWYRVQALTYLREHMSDIPKLLIAKFIALWSPEIRPYAVPPNVPLDGTPVLQYEQPAFQLARVIHVLYFAPLLLLALLGFWRAWVDRRPIAPLLFVFFAVTVTYLIYHPSTRYRVPADPFLFILSGYAVTWLARAAKQGGLAMSTDSPTV
jgi:4-amino-4-deoxy-L-arabinose transferase-like glycosyltransferase